MTSHIQDFPLNTSYPANQRAVWGESSSTYLRVDPGVVLLEALGLVVDDVDVEAVAVGVDALEELAAEELDAHDGEDEPEDETHEEHVEDGGNGVHQSVDNNLNWS